jgi:hypothetical protein
VQPFWTFVRLLGRADAGAAKANSFIGMLLRNIVVVVQAVGWVQYLPTLLWRMNYLNLFTTGKQFAGLKRGLNTSGRHIGVHRIYRRFYFLAQHGTGSH